MTHTTILDFWFTELSAEERFSGKTEIDEMITTRFAAALQAAKAGELWQWRATAEGALAEIIVLDQFSRNIHRGEAEAFAADSMAIALAQVAIAQGYDQALSPAQRQFLYMPYMHSESALIHEEALTLFTDLGDEEALKYERIHKEIIDQFGRYPHRNEQLGRTSTAEEEEYLKNESKGFFNS